MGKPHCMKCQNTGFDTTRDDEGRLVHGECPACEGKSFESVKGAVCWCQCCRAWRIRFRDDLLYLVKEMCRIARVPPIEGDRDPGGVASHTCPKESLEGSEWVRRRALRVGTAQASAEYEAWNRDRLASMRCDACGAEFLQGSLDQAEASTGRASCPNCGAWMETQ